MDILQRKRQVRELNHWEAWLTQGRGAFHIENLEWVFRLLHSGLQVTGLLSRGEQNARTPVLKNLCFSFIDAFKKLRDARSYDPPPYLVFLGNMATDDPEGGVMLDTLQEQAQEQGEDDPDIKFWVNVEDNDRVVGALMHLAEGFIHVSTKEGFGLVVSEALWQGTPVIGSRVGGIQRQVLDGQTGYLVNPLDVDAIAERMSRILDHPEEASVLGKQGQEHVRQHFLLPELVRCYLTLLRFYCGIDQELPQFRLDNMAYSEIIQMLRRPHPDLPSLGEAGAGHVGTRVQADTIEIV